MSPYGLNCLNGIKKTLKTTVFVVVILLVSAVSAGKDQALAAAGINRQINYQGKLLTSSGVAVPSGTYGVTLSLYDAESGGSRLWTAGGSVASPSAINVSVTSEGLFTVLLGSGSQNSLDNVDWNSDSLYLGVTVGSDSEMTPRKRLGAASQAFNALEWDGYRASTSVQSGSEILKLSQTSADAATSNRTTLVLTTSGTSNDYDYLLRALNDSSPVFTISRQGNVTTTGNLYVGGSSTIQNLSLANATATTLYGTLGNFGTLCVGGDCRTSWPTAASTSTWYGSIEWLNATGTNTTSTNLYASSFNAANTTSTNLYVSGMASTTNLLFANATGTNLYATNFSAGTFNTTNLTWANATGTSLYVTAFNAANTTSTNLYASRLYADLLGSTSTFLTVSSTSITMNGRVDAYGLNRWFVNPTAGLVVGGGAATATAGVGPWQLAFDGAYVWVANYTSDTVSKIDVRSNAVAATVSVGDGPRDLAFDGTYLWVTNYAGASVSKVDVRTNAVAATISVGNGPRAITFGLGAAWVANYNDATVSKVDANTNTVVATIPVGTLPYGMTFDGTYVWIANSGPDSISKIDPRTNAVVATSSVGLNPFGLAFDGAFLWSADNGADTVSKIDPRTGSIVATIPVLPDPVYFAFDGTYLWVSNIVSDVVTKIDPRTNAVVATYPTGIDPRGLAFDGAYVWVGNYDGGTGTTLTKIPAIGGSGTGADFLLGANLTPAANNAFDLGSSTVAWRNIYASGTSSFFQGVNWANATGTNTTSTNLYVSGMASTTNLLFANATGTSLYITAFNAVDATATSLGVTSLLVGGKRVCLADGTNCQAVSGGDSAWTDVATGYLYPATSSRSLAIGASATTSAPFVFDINGSYPLLTIGKGSTGGLEVYGSSTLATLNFTNATGSALYASLISAGTICLGGDCRTSWPTGGATSSWYGPIEWSNATGTNTTSTNLYAINFGFAGATGTGLKITGTLEAASTTVTTLGFSNATGTNLYATNFSAGTFSATNLTWSNATGTSLYVTAFNAANATSTNLYASRLYADLIGSTSTFLTVSSTSIALNGRVDAYGLNRWFQSPLTSLTFGSASGTYRRDAGGNIAVSVGSLPDGLAFDGTSMWALSSNSSYVSKIDVRTNRVLSTLNIDSPMAMAFDGSSLWVASAAWESENALKIDVRTNQITATVPVGSTPYGIAYDGASMWVANRDSNNVTKIEVRTNQVVATTTLGWGPAAVVFDGTSIWALSNNANFASKIDVRTNQVVATTTVGDDPMAAAFDGVFLWVANYGSNDISKIDVRTNRVVATTTLGWSPYAIAFDGTYMWVSDLTSEDSNTVSKIDVRTNAVVATMQVGTGPSALAFDGAYVWVANMGSASISKIPAIGANATGENFLLGANLVPAANNQYDLGSASTSWRNIYASGTIAGTNMLWTNATGTNLYATNFSAGTFSATNLSWTNATGTNTTSTNLYASRLYADILMSSSTFLTVSSTSIALNGRVDAYGLNRWFQNPMLSAVLGGKAATTTVGSGPFYMAFDGVNMWVANYWNNTVSKVDVRTGAVVGTVPVGTQPVGVVFDGSSIWVANRGSADVTRIDPKSNVVIATTTVGANPHGLIFDGSAMWAIRNTDYAVKISSTGTVIASVLLPTGSNSNGGSFDGRYIWVSNYGTNNVSKIDTVTNQIVATTSVSLPEQSVFDGTYLWVPRWGSNAVSKIDVNTNTAIASISFEGRGPVAATYDGKYVWFAESRTDTVSKFDPNTHTVVARYPTGSTPTGLAFDGTYIWVSNNGGSTITKILAGGSGSGSSYLFNLDVVPVRHNGIDFGTASTSWRNIYASGTLSTLYGLNWTNATGTNTTSTNLYVSGMASTTKLLFANATGTNLYLSSLLVGGQQVCLADGTHCLITSVPTLQSVIASSPYATSSPVFYGGVTSSNITATGTISNLVTSEALFQAVATIPLNATPRGIAVQGKYAYVTDKGLDRLTVYDLTNPSSPTSVGWIAAGVDPEYVAVQGRYAYVSTLGEVDLTVILPRIAIIDISNPSAPVMASSTSIGSGGGFAVQGSYAYVADYDANVLRVLDVSNPSEPVQVGSVSTGAGSSPQYVAAQGRYAFVSNSGNATVSIIDVLSPTNPVVMRNVPVGTYPVGIAVDGRFAYVANSTDNTVSIIDASNPAAASVVATTTAAFNQPWNLAVRGRDLYVVHSSGVSIVDVSSSTNPSVLATMTAGTNPNDLAISGSYAYVVNGGSNSLTVLRMPGIETAGLIAASAEIGGLNVTTNGTIAGNLSIGSSLIAGAGIFSNGTLAVSGTSTLHAILPASNNAFDIGGSAISWRNVYASGTFAGGALEVSGLSVLHDLTWTNATGTSLYVTAFNAANATSTNFYAALLGFGVANGTSVTSTNLYVTQQARLPADTTIGGLAVCLQTGANCPPGGGDSVWADVDADGYIYPATSSRSVVIGSGATTTAPFVFDLNGSYPLLTIGKGSTAGLEVYGSSTLRELNFTNATGSTLVLNSTSTFLGSIGVGTSTPSEKLTVVGSIQNTMAGVQSFSLVNSYKTSNRAHGIAVRGRYAYIAHSADFVIEDISDPINATTVSRVVTFEGMSSGDGEVALSGNYAYVANESSSTLIAVDVTNPTAPAIVSQVKFAGPVLGIAPSGPFVYVSVGWTADHVYVVDYSDPASPRIVASTDGPGGDRPQELAVSGKYAYVLSSSGFAVFDISNPSLPTQVGLVRGIAEHDDLAVQGRYAYVVNTGNTVGVIDIANPAAPVQIATSTIGMRGHGIAVSGRYVYATTLTSNQLFAIDVSSSTNPVIVASSTLPTNVSEVAVAGQYAYITSYAGGTNSDFRILKIPGMETSSLIAHSLEAGSLSVRGDAMLAGKISADGLFVGSGGIFSNGYLAVSATSTLQDVYTSINNRFDLGTASTSWRNIYASGTSSYFQGINWTNATGTTLNFINATGSSLFSASLGSTFFYTGNAALTNTTSTSLYVSGLSALQNATFANASGTTLDLTGNFNAGSSTITTLNFTNATGSSLYASLISAGTICLGGDCRTSWPSGGTSFSWSSLQFPPSNNTYSLGSATGSLANVYASGTISAANVSVSGRLDAYGLNRWFQDPALSLAFARGSATMTAEAPIVTAFDGTYIWATDGDNPIVNKIDPRRNEIVGTVPIDDIAGDLEFDGSRLWVGLLDGGPYVYAVDVTTDRVVATATLSTIPSRLLFDGTFLWVGQGAGLAKVSVTSSQLVTTIPFGMLLSGMAFDGTNIWIADAGDGTAWKFNPRSDAAVSAFSDAELAISGFAFDGAYVWAIGSDDNLSKIDPRTSQIVATISLGQTNSTDILFDGRYLWVDSYAFDDVLKIDVDTNSIVATYPTGSFPAYMTFDGVNVWIPNADDNSMTKIPSLGGGYGADFLVNNKKVCLADGTNCGLSWSALQFPPANNTYSLGSATGSLANIYASGTIAGANMLWTNATGTNLYASNFSTGTFNTTNLTWTNATGTNTTSTNLYASRLYTDLLMSSSTFLTVSSTSITVNGRVDAYGLNRWFQSPISRIAFGNGTATTTGSGTVLNGVAFDGAFMWVANGPLGTVSKVDVRTNQILTSVPVGIQPQELAFDGTFIWVTNSGSSTVSKIDARTNFVAATTTVGGTPDGIAFDGSSIWVANYASGTVSKINPATNLVTLSRAVGTKPRGVAFDGASIWVTNVGSNSVSKIDVATNLVVATTTVGGSPSAVAFDGTSIWVANYASGTVSKIDTRTNAVLATVSVGSGPRSVVFDGSYVWVANLGSSTLSKIDVKTNAVVRTYAAGNTPRGLAFDGTFVWVAENAYPALIDDFNRADNAAVGNGWTPDLARWDISGNALRVQPVGSDADNYIYRPSTESATNTQVTVDFNSTDLGNYPQVRLRSTGTTGYVFFASDSSASGQGAGVIRVINGSFTRQWSAPTAAVANHNYRMIASVQTNGSQVDLTLRILDLDDGGTEVYDKTWHDTEASRITAGGVQGLSGYSKGTILYDNFNLTNLDSISISSLMKIPAGGSDTGSDYLLHANIVPDTNTNWDIGSASASWRNIYASGTIAGANAVFTNATATGLNFTNATGSALYAPLISAGTICLNGDCRTSWPSGGSTSSWYGPIEWSNATGTNTTSTNLYASRLYADLLSSTSTFLTVSSTTIELNGRVDAYGLSRWFLDPVMSIAVPGRAATTTIWDGVNSIVFDGVNMWAGGADSAVVWKVDARTGSVIATVPVGSSGSALAFDGTNIWAVNGGTDNVTKIDVRTNTVVATTTVGDSPYVPVFDGSFVWVANYNDGTVSKIDPASASVVATVPVGANPFGTTFDGRHVWVANAGGASLSKIDVSTNTVIATATVGLIPTGVVFDGSHIWVMNTGESTVSKVDIQTNAVVATLPLAVSEYSPQFAFDGKYLWIPSTDNTVAKIDVETNAIVARYAAGSLPRSTAFDGAYIWVTNRGSGDITKIPAIGGSGTGANFLLHANLVPDVTSHNTFDLGSASTSWRNVYASGTVAAVNAIFMNATATNFYFTNATWTGSLVNTLSSESPFLRVSSSTVASHPTNVFVQGKYAYVITALGNFTILDISNPDYPKQVSATSLTASNLEGIFVSGRYAYIADYGGGTFIVVDVSNPALPVQVSMLVMGGSPRNVVVYGHYAYVTQATGNSLSIIDVSDSADPRLISNLGGMNGARGLAVNGRYAYVGAMSDNVLYAVDVYDPANPRIVNSVGTDTGTFGTYVQGAYVYVTNYTAGTFSIVDASNPMSLKLVSTIATGAATRNVFVAGRYAYVESNSTGRIFAIDVSSSTNPVIVKTIQTDGSPYATFASGKHLFTVNSAGSDLWIYRIPGLESAAIMAQSLEAGMLNVDAEAMIGGNLIVGSGLNVGLGGIMTNGSIAAMSTTTASVFIGGVSSTAMTFTNATGSSLYAPLISAGTICLGGDCQTSWPTGGATSSWYGLIEWSNATGTNTTSTNLYVSGMASTTNLLFVSATGTNLFSTSLGSASFYTTNATITNATGTTLALTGNFSAGSSTVTTLNFTNATGTSLYTSRLNADLITSTSTFLTVSSTSITMNGRVDAYGLNRWFQNPVLSAGFGGGAATSAVTSPVGVAFDGTFVWAMSGADQTVSKVDTRKNQIVATVSTGGYPVNGAFDGSTLWVGHYGTSYVSRIDARSGALLGTVTTGGDPRSMAFDGTYMWVVNMTSNTVSKIFVATSTRDVIIPVGSNPDGIAFDGSYMWVVNSETNATTLTQINAYTNAVVSTSTLGSWANEASAAGYVSGIAFDGTYLWISAYAPDVVIKFDPRTRQVVSVVNVGADPYSLLFDGTFMWVANGSADTVSKIDKNTNAVVATYPTGNDPAGLAFDGAYIWVANWSSGNFTKILAGGSSVGAGLHLNANLFVGTSTQIATNLGAARNFGIYAATVASTTNSVGTPAGGLFVYTSSTNATSTFIYNAASNRNAVLEVRGGCATSTSDLAVFGRADDNRVASIRCNGGIYSDYGVTVTQGADYAEYFSYVGAPPRLGDVIAIDAASATTVRRGDRLARERTLGVVSPGGAVVGNGVLEGAERAVQVGLLGQLRVNAIATGNPISIGDRLMMSDDGYAVKAKGPGMVIGTALEGLVSGTGTVMTYVSPAWWAGDLLTVSENGSILSADLSVSSAETASASSTAVSSPLFAFEGSAYDEASSTVIVSSYAFQNVVESATTSRFVLWEAGSREREAGNSTELLSISQDGDLSLAGSLTFGTPSLVARNSQLATSISFLDATGTAGGRMVADGWGARGTEYAVTFTSEDESLALGDLVAIDREHPGDVVKAGADAGFDLVGVVSARPGFLSGTGEGEHRWAVAIGGQAEVKISLENGPIAAGDALVPSSESGAAMKASSTGIALGTALEAFDGSTASSTIRAFVRVGWVEVGEAGSREREAGSGAASGEERTGLATIYAGGKSVTVTFESVGSFAAVQATPYGIPVGGFGITEVTDRSFRIVLLNAQMTDMTFAWSAKALPASGKIDFSDGSSAPYDQLTGQPVPRAPLDGAPPPPDLEAESGTDAGTSFPSEEAEPSAPPDETPPEPAPEPAPSEPAPEAPGG